MSPRSWKLWQARDFAPNQNSKATELGSEARFRAPILSTTSLRGHPNPAPSSADFRLCFSWICASNLAQHSPVITGSELRILGYDPLTICAFPLPVPAPNRSGLEGDHLVMIRAFLRSVYGQFCTVWVVRAIFVQLGEYPRMKTVSFTASQ